MTDKLRPVRAVELEDQDESFLQHAELVSAEQLNEYEEVVARAVNGNHDAIVQLYHSGVLDKLANSVARMIAGASHWDIAVAKEDMVHMAVVEMLSSSTYISINELTRLLYTATRNNVIDIVRRSGKVKFEPLGDNEPYSAGVSLQAQIERTEWASTWNRQLTSWYGKLSRVDQSILRATMKDQRPRAIARLMFQGDWTNLTKEQQNQLSAYVSRRLYKLRAKLAIWIRSSELKGHGP